MDYLTLTKYKKFLTARKKFFRLLLDVIQKYKLKKYHLDNTNEFHILLAENCKNN